MAASSSLLDAQAPPRSGARANTLLRRALRVRQTQVGLVLTLAILAVAFIGPYFAPYSAQEIIGIPFSKPSPGLPLGTDYLGHDVLSVILLGGRTVVWMSLVSVIVGLTVGVAIGIVAAYNRSRLDDLLMGINDVVLAFPNIVLVLLFVSMIGPKLWLIVLIVAITWTPQVARVARAATLEIVNREFVESSEVLGVPQWRILMRDILPNITGPLMVEFGLRITWSVSLIAAVSFIGAGVQPPQADWGLMIKQNQAGIVQQPWVMVAPMACLAILTVGVNMMSDGLARAVAGAGRKEEPST